MVSATRRYYTLVASLPSLPRFDRAKPLPINRERLRTRLGMLHPEDAAVAERVEHFLQWRRQPSERTDAELAASYSQVVRAVRNLAIAALLEFQMDLRTIMAALRRRRLGLPAPVGDRPWGAGRWVRHIASHWDEPHFALEHVHPWIVEAGRMLELDEAQPLERLLLELTWSRLEHSAEAQQFGFDAVLVYLFKRDIVEQWLYADESKAATRFGDLVSETIGERGQLFA